MDVKNITNAQVADTLKNGGVAVVPTDTIYGVVGSALRPETVARIYRIRKRNLKKPMIVLVASRAQARRLGASWDAAAELFLQKVWPGPVSVVLPCNGKKFRYLHRGTRTVAFRLSADRALRDLLEKTGPLVAPSANPEGKPPARTIREAREYFGNKVDCYADGGRLAQKPSALIKIQMGKPVAVRRGQ